MRDTEVDDTFSRRIAREFLELQCNVFRARSQNQLALIRFIRRNR